MHLYKLGGAHHFPSADDALADPNGLLAYGGDLSVERLVHAYRNGIFPWFGEQEPYLWWSPNPRGVLALSDLYISSSLRKLLRQRKYTVSLNRCFERVIDACANVPRRDQGTWITAEMIQAYKNLHHSGVAHSVEVWQQDELIGGLYGVGVGKVFCGESMFHTRTDASKVAFVHLVEHLKTHDFALIDCQMQNPHLQSLGVKEVAREWFISLLHQHRDRQPTDECWRAKNLVVGSL